MSLLGEKKSNQVLFLINRHYFEYFCHLLVNLANRGVVVVLVVPEICLCTIQCK